MYSCSLQKLKSHLDGHSVYSYSLQKLKSHLNGHSVYIYSLQKLKSHLDGHSVYTDSLQKLKSHLDGHSVYSYSLQKLKSHLDGHSVYYYSYYKVARIFDPRQLPTLSHNISDYCAFKTLKNHHPLCLKSFIYCRSPEDLLPNPLVLHDRLSLLSLIVRAMWLPVTSVGVLGSFSQYKHLLNDRRETLTEKNSKRLMML